MYPHAQKLFSMIILILSFCVACAPTKVKTKESTVLAEDSSPLSSYNITIPPGWSEVMRYKEIEKRVFWSFSLYNYTVWQEKPQIRAWDSPEEVNTFLTVHQLKRHRNLGIGTLYPDIIRFMNESGAEVQETGVTKIHDSRCKWWVQSIAGGQVYQHCFLFAHEAYIYIFCFTTTYLSEEKKELFEEIAKTITYNASYADGDDL